MAPARWTNNFSISPGDNRRRSVSGQWYPNAPLQRGGERGGGASAPEGADALYLQHMHNLPGVGGRGGEGRGRGGSYISNVALLLHFSYSSNSEKKQNKCSKNVD